MHGLMKISSVISSIGVCLLGVSGRGTESGPSQSSGVVLGSMSCMPLYS